MGLGRDSKGKGKTGRTAPSRNGTHGADRRTDVPGSAALWVEDCTTRSASDSGEDDGRGKWRLCEGPSVGIGTKRGLQTIDLCFKEPMPIRPKTGSYTQRPRDGVPPWVPASPSQCGKSLPTVCEEEEEDDDDRDDGQCKVALRFNGKEVTLNMKRHLWGRDAPGPMKGQEPVLNTHLWATYSIHDWLAKELCGPGAVKGAEGAGARGKGTAGASGTVGSQTPARETVVGRGGGTVVRHDDTPQGDVHFFKRSGE